MTHRRDPLAALLRHDCGYDANHLQFRGPVPRARILFIAALVIFVAAKCVSNAWGAEPYCRAAIELIAEATLVRGEELVRVLEQPDGTVQALMHTTRDFAGPESWTLLLVTAGEDLDQACVVASSDTGQPS